MIHLHIRLGCLEMPQVFLELVARVNMLRPMEDEMGGAGLEGEQGVCLESHIREATIT